MAETAAPKQEDKTVPAVILQNFSGVTQGGVEKISQVESLEDDRAPASPVQDAVAEEVPTKMDKALAECWGGCEHRDMLVNFVNPDAVEKKKKGVFFHLDNGIDVMWSTQLMKGPDGAPVEFIGVKGRLFGTPAFDQDAADAVIALAISRGWKSINLHGKDEHKEMMWLTAQKAGLPVSNFMPKPDSKVWEQLREEDPAAYQRTMQKILHAGQQQNAPEEKAPETAAIAQTAALAGSKFAAPEDPFEAALQQRIDQAQDPAAAEGLKQVLSDVKGGKIKLEEDAQKAFLQKLDSPIVQADAHGRTVTPYQNAMNFLAQATGPSAGQTSAVQEKVAASIAAADEPSVIRPNPARVQNAPRPPEP